MMKKLMMGLFVMTVAGLPLVAHADWESDMKQRGANLEQQGKNVQDEGKATEKRGQDLEQRGENVRSEGEHARDTGEHDYKTGRQDLNRGVETTEGYEHQASDAYHHRGTVEKKRVTKVRHDGDGVHTTTTTSTRESQ